MSKELIERMAAFDGSSECWALISEAKDLICSLENKLEQQQKQLATSQAQIKVLRGALYFAKRHLTVGSPIHIAAEEALDTPTDDSALRELLKAERERCIDVIETHRIPVGQSPAGEMACDWTYDALHEIRDTIRARGAK